MEVLASRGSRGGAQVPGRIHHGSNLQTWC